LDEQGRLFTYLLTDHLYVQGGAMNNGGIALQWFVQNFLTQQETEEESIDLFFQSVQKVPAGSDGLVFLPYLLGERAPVWDAEAKAVFIGIKSSHTRQHFMRAVIEGICFAMRQLLQLLETAGTVETIYATGGFTRSPVWLQMLADILHKKIVLSSTADASAMGAVFMAMHAKGVIRKWQDVHRLLTCEKAYEPRAAESGLYETNIRVFGHLYEKLKDDFVLLSRQEKNA
jgi:gluconokinase